MECVAFFVAANAAAERAERRGLERFIISHRMCDCFLHVFGVCVECEAHCAGMDALLGNQKQQAMLATVSKDLAKVCRAPSSTE